MNSVIYVVATVLVVVGGLGILFNRRLDRWIEPKVRRFVPRSMREHSEPAFGTPAEYRTALKVAAIIFLIGLLALLSAPVLS